MTDHSDVLTTLQQCDLGRGLSAEELGRVADLGIRQSLDAGSEILRQLGPAAAVYIPCSGSVMVERSSINGRRQVIDFLRRGDYLGFTATSNYLYSAYTLEPSVLLKLPRRQFSALCDEIAVLKQNVAHINNTVLATLLDHLFAIGQKRAHERLAFLIQQVQQRSNCCEAGALLHLPMSRSDIGDYLGLTLETTSRAFSKLRNDGVLATPDHHSAVVLDQQRLDELAEVK